MKPLVREKEKAIELRKKGHSYKEILTVVPVAKSSLSLWLKDLPLTKDEKKVLKTRTDSNISHGRIKAASVHAQNRIQREKEQFIVAKQLFTKYSTDTLFHTGIALYWAEGAKRSNMFMFINSDIEMVEIMLLWIEKFTEYTREDLGYRLFVHQAYAHKEYEQWWVEKLCVSKENLKKTVYKPSKFDTQKRVGYKGCIRVEVPKSSVLLFYMKCWMSLMVEYYGNK